MTLLQKVCDKTDPKSAVQNFGEKRVKLRGNKLLVKERENADK